MACGEFFDDLLGASTAIAGSENLLPERIELRVFKDSYHMLSIDNDRVEVARACGAFLATIAAPDELGLASAA